MFQAVFRLRSMSNKELAEKMGIFATTGINKGKPSSYAFQKALSRHTQALNYQRIMTAKRLHDEGKSNVEIGRIMGTGESTVRSLLKDGRELTAGLTYRNAAILKSYVDKHKYVDVSDGVNELFGINQNRFKSVVEYLEDAGYHRYFIKIDQMGTGNKTTLAVLTPPDIDYSETLEHKFDIRFPYQENRVISPEGDISSLGLNKVNCVDSSRVAIDYESPDDGLIRLRPGVEDLSLGNKHYAQIRIGVDGTHYIKGMAVIADPSVKFPPGKDILVSTNKKEGTPLYTDNLDDKQVLKPMKLKNDGTVDWDNPFGATIDRDSDIMTTTREYYDRQGKKCLSAINVLREEGAWAEYEKSLSPQLLSKQYVVKRQIIVPTDCKLAAN